MSYIAKKVKLRNSESKLNIAAANNEQDDGTLEHLLACQIACSYFSALSVLRLCRLSGLIDQMQPPLFKRSNCSLPVDFSDYE